MPLNEPLQEENTRLHIELKDLNELILIREEELELLRKKAEETARLRSELENQLLAMRQLEASVNLYEKKMSGAGQREQSLEEELLAGIDMEKSYYKSRDLLNRLQAELAQAREENLLIKELHARIAALSTQNAALESRLEILDMDKEFLMEELNEWRSGKVPDSNTASDT